MPAPRRLLATLAVLAAATACPDETDVSTLTASFFVDPAEVELSSVWAGYDETVAVAVHHVGSAPLLGLTVAVGEQTGPAEVTARLEGDALAPGGVLSLRVTVSAPAGASGQVSASLVVDAGADGAVTVPLFATVLTPPSCEDANPCTADSFDPAAGRCLHEALDDGASCHDGSACTDGDACLSGRCVGAALACVDDEPCTLDACDPSVGCVFEPIHSRCDDDDPCTDDVCAPAAGCRNPPLADGAVCHFAGCAEIGLCFTGQCVLSEVPDGMPCEDGDACTANDTCRGGECTSGLELGEGAAPPLVFAPAGVVVDLCRGPGASSGCYGWPDEPGLERVLAAERDGDRLRLVWQGTYVDPYGTPCDPTDPLYAPLTIDTEGERRGGAMPEVLMCAAGVHLTTIDLGSAVATPATRQLTAVRGPAAAAFVPRLETMTGAADEVTDPIEEPPPLERVADVVIAHPDFLRLSVFLELRDRDGELVTPAVHRGPWPLALPIAGLAVDVDPQRIALVAHADRVELPAAVCDGPGCDLASVPLWTVSESRHPGGAAFERVVALEREIDSACDAATPGPLPLDLHDVTVFVEGSHLRVSLRSSRSLCGDVAPGTLGVPADAPRPYRQAAWWFTVDPGSAVAYPPMTPLESYATGEEPLGAFRTTREGGAAALRHVAHACLDPSLDCVCGEGEGACFDTLVERTSDLDTAPPEPLLSAASAGAALGGQTAPLLVDGELRVATLLSPPAAEHLQLLGTGPGGALSRLVAPAPPAPLVWDATAPLLPGPPNSSVVVGTGLDPTTEVLRRHALVQVFGCGLGAATPEGLCLEDADCAESWCDLSVCLAAPDCAADGMCDLCWGQCAELEDGDAGVAQGDAGDAG